ncbi:MAG TPA: methyltransferase [Mycobacteriales bacterium]|nr:methyltransferase [Mycobacteriales bacterium]
MSDRLAPRASVRTAVVWQVLRALLDERAGGGQLAVLDAGGGTGGFAVPLAGLGHAVTVVDPSPDSLAALERRAAEAGVSDRITARQGDAAGLLDLVGPGGQDVVLCHSVLEVVDDPAAAMAAVAAVLRPGGVVSVLAATRSAAVLARVLAGRLADAMAMLADPGGRGGPADPLARRFDLDGLRSLVTGAGLVPGPVHAIQVFSDLVPSGLLDAEPEALVALEERVGGDPAFQPLASQLHLVAERVDRPAP